MAGWGCQLEYGEKNEIAVTWVALPGFCGENDGCWRPQPVEIMSGPGKDFFLTL
jgi:hypothetical protein